MNRNRRLGACVLCAFLVLALLFSSALTVHAADHDCTGEHCPVCHQLAANADVLRLLGFAALLLAAFVMLAWAAADRLSVSAAPFALHGTLVRMKVRLND